MGNSGIATKVQTTVATVTGRLADGKIIQQEITLPHEAGVNNGVLLGHAIGSIRSTGGILVGQPDGSITFYSLLMIPGGINIKLNKVSLASANTLTQ